MKFLAAPLIYSRTPKIGFNPSFLVYPEGISNLIVPPEKISDLTNFRRWAFSFVESALVSQDYIREDYRLCSFQNDEYIVIGICAVAEFLCDDPNYLFVDKEKRMNHGFFGYVFKKESFQPFFIPKFGNEEVPHVFKELYQYVIKYWQEDDSDPEKNSHPEPYKEVTFEFEEISESGDTLPSVNPEGTMCLPQERYYNRYPQVISAGYSFCSNMPSPQDMSHSQFDYVFIPKLAKVTVAERNIPASQASKKNYEQKPVNEVERVESEFDKLPREERDQFIRQRHQQFPILEQAKDLFNSGLRKLGFDTSLEEKPVETENAHEQQADFLNQQKTKQKEQPSMIATGMISKYKK